MNYHLKSSFVNTVIAFQCKCMFSSLSSLLTQRMILTNNVVIVIFVQFQRIKLYVPVTKKPLRAFFMNVKMQVQTNELFFIYTLDRNLTNWMGKTTLKMCHHSLSLFIDKSIHIYIYMPWINMIIYTLHIFLSSV